MQVFFGGGIDRSLPQHLIPDGACRNMVNVYYPREIQTPRTRPGLVQYLAGTAVPGKVTAVHVYQKSASTQFVVLTCLNAEADDQELYYLDASKEAVQISAALGSLESPCLLTYNGRLLVALPGKNLRVWLGNTSTSPTAAKAHGHVTVTTQPDDGETVTIAGQQFTFQAVGRATLGEVQIGGTTSVTATNLAAAINIDCTNVSAAPSTNSVTVTARLTGVAGNSLALVDGTAGNLSLSAATLAGGVDGLALDEVDTYEAPQPAMICSDKMGRVVAAGDPAHPDRVFFSAPNSEMEWAEGDYGDGEIADIGYLEGNSYSAIAPFMDEIFVHKTGQNKEIHRLHVVVPDPAEWFAQKRFYAGCSAALNHRCAVSVADKHVSLDADTFRVYQGTDTYDEIASGMDGSKVYDLIEGTAGPTGFLVVNPLHLHVMVFPAAGSRALIYHYGSRRWTSWEFQIGDRTICSAVYSEDLGAMLLGLSDGVLYKLDPAVCTDDGTPFASTIVGKSIGGEAMSVLVVKQTLIDYQHHIAGAGTCYLVANRDESLPQALFDFTVDDTGLELSEALMELYEATMPFASEVYGRVGSVNQGKGETVAPKVVLRTGAFSLNNMTILVAYTGRATQ